MSQHQWSGWPGAFCLKCHAEHALENAIGMNWFDPATGKFDTPEHEREVKEADGVCPINDEVYKQRVQQSPEVIDCPCCGHYHAELIVRCPKCTEEILFGGLSIQVPKSNCSGCLFFHEGGEFETNDCRLCVAFDIEETCNAQDAMPKRRPKYCPLQKNYVIVKLRK